MSSGEYNIIDNDVSINNLKWLFNFAVLCGYGAICGIDNCPQISDNIIKSEPQINISYFKKLKPLFDRYIDSKYEIDLYFHELKIFLINNNIKIEGVP